MFEIVKIEQKINMWLEHKWKGESERVTNENEEKRRLRLEDLQQQGLAKILQFALSWPSSVFSTVLFYFSSLKRNA